MRNARLDEAQAGIKIAGRNINNLRYADDNHPYGRKWRRTKEPVDESERTEWKAGLRLKKQSLKNKDHGIWSHHFMANRWGNSGNSLHFHGNRWGNLILLGFKIIARGDCSYEIKRHLLLGRKAMTNLNSILRRDITLLTKVRLVKAMVFPVVMYGCESWTIKKAEHWRIDAFQLWCWRSLLTVPYYSNEIKSVHPKGNQSWILEGLMSKLNLQYSGHLMWRTDSLEKTLMLGKIEGRRRGWQEDEMVGCHHWLDGHEYEQVLGFGDGQRILTCCSPWGCKESDMTEQLNWL